MVSNRASPERGVRLHSIALGVHGDDGSVRFRLSLETPLEPGENAVLNDERPVQRTIVAVEAFFRVMVPDLGRVLDAYAKIEASDEATSLRDVEVGINDIDGEPIDGETPIDDAPGLTCSREAMRDHQRSALTVITHFTC